MDVTINTMEVLETRPLNELVAEAIIKVCYVSDEPNRNCTVITKDVGRIMAASLPGAPVAGFFNKDTGDFEQHNRLIYLENGEIIVEDQTRPYGFVSPVDAPWYQDFMEDGELRTYLMCKAYFWTRQYEEASLALNKGQSMELDEKSMVGYYTDNQKVFVFTSVTLDKLCILGDNFEPAFSGAKIMSNYTKQFDSFAEELEKTIGRRYYIMDNQLVVKPENVTLKYALELGWNLTDAIYAQLATRGAEEKYSVQGVYTENNEIFTILQDRETLEYVRCIITITDQEAITMAPEMQAVVMAWTPKTPDAPAPVTPLSPSAPVPAVYAAEPATEPVVEPAAEPAVIVAEPVTEPPVATEPVIVPATEPITAEPAAPAAPATSTTLAAPVAPVAPAAPTVATDFTAQIEAVTATFNAKFEALERDLLAKNTELATYRAAQAKVVDDKKSEMITSYSTLLDVEEIAPITANLAKYTLDELESKLAVTYTRKQRANTPNTRLQLNINTMPSETQLPDFIKQAQEFDKNYELRLT